jgi:death on curing protein
MAGPRWLARASVLAFHEVSLARFGGLAGIRDEGLLDSALARPEMLLNDEPGTGVHRLAAWYAVGLARNHPYVDGNKRTAFLAAYVFLRDNGWRLTASQPALVVAMLGVASGTLDEMAFAAWLEANTVRESP